MAPWVGDELVDVIVRVDADPPVAAGLGVVEVPEVVVVHVRGLGEDLKLNVNLCLCTLIRSIEVTK